MVRGDLDSNYKESSMFEMAILKGTNSEFIYFGWRFNGFGSNGVIVSYYSKFFSLNVGRDTSEGPYASIFKSSFFYSCED